MASRFETNILRQPELIGAVLDSPRPAWMARLRSRRVHFVGIGTSRHAAQIAECLWRRWVSPRAAAVHSFDFVRLPQPVARGDAVVLLSHRGSKSFTVQAAAKARRLGAVTVAITGRGSRWRHRVDHRLETCEPEDTGAFTKSLTTTLAWIVRWIGEPGLEEGARRACARLPEGPAFPRVSAGTDLILLGDLEREWVARETALKLQEAARLRARAFGLEEFLHGPRISAGPGSLAVAFGSPEPRWRAVLDYLKTIAVPAVVVEDSQTPAPARWLSQLFWGQRLTLSACRDLRRDPDSLRTEEPLYRPARKKLVL